MGMVDGFRYPDGKEPDMGSIRCTGYSVSPTTGKEVREYAGLSTDFDKLPTYDCLATGSIFVTTDTKEGFFYNEETKTWE